MDGLRKSYGPQGVMEQASIYSYLVPADRPTSGKTDDPTTGLMADIRLIQPYLATKVYICPACGGDITLGTAHYVLVPTDAPDLRRHWHRHCWERPKHRTKRPPR